MLMRSPAVKIAVAILAFIGAIASLAVIGMLIMHGTMMSGIGSTEQMSAMCQSIMGSPR